MDFLLGESADEVDSGGDVAPLVLSAALKRAAVIAVEDIIIVRLEEHVAELHERNARFHAELDGLGGQHFVDAEFGTDVTQEVEIFHLAEPVDVVRHDDVVIGEEAAQLSADRFTVLCDFLFCEDRACFLFSGGVADKSGRASDECDRVVTGLLEPAHAHHGKKVTYMKAVAGRVEAYVIGNGSVG